MNITFFLVGQKEYKSIYVRIRDTDIDAKVSTRLKIKETNFKNGTIKLTRIRNKLAEEKQKTIINNENLIKLKEKLNEISQTITNKYNSKKEYETINSQWLKEILNHKSNKLPTTFVEYFDFYLHFRKSSIKKSTYKKLNVYKNRVKQFEIDTNTTVYIPEINRRFSLNFQDWCDQNNYAQNTKIQTLKIIKTICNHAKEHGVKTHPELDYITKGLKSEKKENIYLDFEEIKKISTASFSDKKLDIARDWLVISCYTALRVSDNLKLTKEKIKKIGEDYFLQIIQQKTNQPVDIYLNENVMKILKKRQMNFPPVFSTNNESNEAIYNRLIKDVCRIAKIDKKVKVFKRNNKTNRYEMIEIPKYKAVSSHIGRRSFATNYYGIIPTSLLIGQTGHSSEAQFLRYVGKKGNQNALLLAEKMKNLKS